LYEQQSHPLHGCRESETSVIGCGYRPDGESLLGIQCLEVAFLLEIFTLRGRSRREPTSFVFGSMLLFEHVSFVLRIASANVQNPSAP